MNACLESKIMHSGVAQTTKSTCRRIKMNKEYGERLHLKSTLTAENCTPSQANNLWDKKSAVDGSNVRLFMLELNLWMFK